MKTGASQREILRQLFAMQDRLLRLEEAVKEIRDFLAGPPATRIRFRVSLDGGQSYHMLEQGEQMQAKVNQKILVHIEGADEFGNVAPFDPTTPVTWEPTGDVAIEVDPNDSAKAAITSVAHTPSTGNLAQVTADADVTSGVKPITGNLSIDWLPGDAVTVAIKVDTIEAV